MIKKINTKDWEKVNFGDVVLQVKDRVKREETGLQYYLGGEHFDCGEVHIKRKGTIEENPIGPAFHMRFKPGHVLLVSRNPHLRKASLADFEGICANTTYVCEAVKEKILPEFLPFLMQSDAFWYSAELNKRGSTNPYLNWGDFTKFKFRLPPLPEQKRLADLLWSIDKAIESYAEILNRLSVTYLIELKNMATIKGIEKKVGDIAHLHYGDGLREKDRHDGPYLVVGSSGVVGKHIECRVKGPGIVVGRKGSAGEVLWIEDDFWPIDTTYWVEIKSQKDMVKEYLYYVLKSLNLPSLTITTAVPGLNRDDVLLKTISVPGLSVQSKVVEKFRFIQLFKGEVNNLIMNTKNIQKQIINQIFG